MNIAYWACAVFTAISAAVSFGYATAGLRSTERTTPTSSLYAFSRSLALLGTAVVALFTGSVPFVAAVAVAMVSVQAGDAVVGGMTRDRMKTIGPAITAVVNLVVLIWMLVVS